MMRLSVRPGWAAAIASDGWDAADQRLLGTSSADSLLQVQRSLHLDLLVSLHQPCGKLLLRVLLVNLSRDYSCIMSNRQGEAFVHVEMHFADTTGAEPMWGEGGLAPTLDKIALRL